MISVRGIHRVRGIQLGVVLFVAFAATAASSCLDTKVTFCDTDLLCPPGFVCSAAGDACIRAGSCGNAQVNEGEVCDDGNNQSGDGCSADCASNEACGNNIIDIAVGEVCDDGNQTPGDGCSAECGNEACGNFSVDVDAGEQCDTGPGDSEGCDKDCTFRRCGDGYVNETVEDCDVMGAMGDTDTCDGDCTFPKCGDNHTNATFKQPNREFADFEECDTGGNTAACNGNDNDTAEAQGKGDCQKPACGDGYFNEKFDVPGANGKLEACDDGGNTDSCNGNDNLASGTGNCQKPACGDNYTNSAFTPPGGEGKPEECDPGEENSPTCNSNENASGKGNCQPAACGDGYLNIKTQIPGGQLEVCDPGAANSATCNANGPGPDAARCQPPSCGDGYTNEQFRPSGPGGPVEACDDVTNTANCNGNGPGSDAAKCQKPACGDGYFNSAAEQCDASAPNGEQPCGGGSCLDTSCTCAT